MCARSDRRKIFWRNRHLKKIIAANERCLLSVARNLATAEKMRFWNGLPLNISQVFLIAILYPWNMWSIATSRVKIDTYWLKNISLRDSEAKQNLLLLSYPCG